MKQILILSFVLSAFYICAEKPYIKDAEPGFLEIGYERVLNRDSTRPNKKLIDNTILRIGKNKSLFCGVKQLWNDSLVRINREAYSAALFAALDKDKGNPNNLIDFGGSYLRYTYKNYPEGMVTECDFFDLGYLRYEEPWEKPQWEITDSVKDCLGYSCLYATTNFRGRKWEAWFAPEIPISDGPWKLCGLPGIILEARDSTGTYSFTAHSIRQENIADVGFMGYKNYEKTTRDKYFESWWKFKHSNFAAKMRAAFMERNGKTPEPLVAPSKKKLNYDMEETNYNHKL